MAAAGFTTAASPRPQIGRPILLGSVAILVFFGGFGSWSALAPLSAAAHAPGQVRVESYRKTVQHLEGGIIREILVNEGDHVTAGQLLVRLDDLQSGSALSMVEDHFDALSALEARLTAERDGLDEIVFPHLLLDRAEQSDVAEILDGEKRVFDSRRTRLLGQTEVLGQRVGQLNSEISAYQAQIAAAKQQIALVSEEVKIVRDLVARELERRPRLLALEKELAQIKGDLGEQQGLLARAQQGIGEAELQILELENARVEEAAGQLRDVQAQLSELAERIRSASDVRDRTNVVAPQDGRVVQMRHFTSGGVIRPGDPILDIVPDDGDFVIEARVSPLDIDTVHAGLDAEIKLTALKQRNLPILIGTVTSVSADALTDQRTGQSYYVAEVVLPPEQTEQLAGAQLYPGMPSEVLIRTGERTPLQYFLDPFEDSFRRAFRED